jgi:hypothetical protein
MALDKTTLTNTLETIFEDLSGKTAAQKASEIADAIDVFVKSGAVNTTVTGTAPGPTFPSTVSGTGTGSVT